MVGNRRALLSPDGSHLACYRRDSRTVGLWTWPDGREAGILEGHKFHIVAMVFAPDGRSLATGDVEGIVKIWDLPAGRERASWRAHAGPVGALAYSSTGSLIASASLLDTAVRLWDASGEARGAVPSARKVVSLAFAPDGSLLLLGDFSGTVRLVDTATTREQARFRLSDSPINRLVIAPDSRLLATASSNLVQLWALSSLRRRGGRSRGRRQVPE
jgi:WD40 repeat protein